MLPNHVSHDQRFIDCQRSLAATQRLIERGQALIARSRLLLEVSKRTRDEPPSQDAAATAARPVARSAGEERCRA